MLAQETAILELLREANGDWVPLPRLLTVQGPFSIVANIGARMTALRKRGHNIENDKWWEDGQWHSAYRLRDMPQPAREGH